MKYLKRFTAVILAAALVMGFAGCSKKSSSKDFTSALDACGIEQTTEYNEIASSISNNGAIPRYYIAKDAAEAKQFGNAVVNRFKQFPELDAKEFIAGIDSIKGSNNKRHATLFCYIVLSSSKSAKTAYDDLVEHYTDHDGNKFSSGKSGGYTYTIEHSESETGTGGCTGIYLQGDTVIYIRGLATTGDGYELADKFCEKFGVISPSKA